MSELMPLAVPVLKIKRFDIVRLQRIGLLILNHFYPFLTIQVKQHLKTILAKQLSESIIVTKI
jgi:hypothetical protein